MNTCTTRKGCQENKKMQMISQLILGVQHLHKLNIVHRDLKPQNVLLDDKNQIKISDMGLAKKMPNGRNSMSQTTNAGTIGWMAAEAMREGGRMSKKVDIFSLGCLIHYIFKKRHPFGDKFQREGNILNNKPNILETGLSRWLIGTMIAYEGLRRPTIDEVAIHPLFWSADKRLRFLIDTSDLLEFQREDSSMVLAWEAYITKIVGPSGDWSKCIAKELKADLVRYRSYNTTKLRDLIRVIRNKAGHYRDLPPALQNVLGSLPEGYTEYFQTKFPMLLPQAYLFIKRHRAPGDVFEKYYT
mmetsp:Transcript_17515/g.19505  ORF Transcript_17515/g.19505 Transcript_17515/m.19505 type:complete len:300 (+) Transcript_17515:17-916(+)